MHRRRPGHHQQAGDGHHRLRVELSKGSVSFHHCLVYHRSEPNRSPHSRRACTVIFMTGESRWVGEEDYRYAFLHVQGKPSPVYEAMKHVRVDELSASRRLPPEEIPVSQSTIVMMVVSRSRRFPN